MINLGVRTLWLSSDFASKSLDLLALQKDSLDLQHDEKVLHSTLSDIELGRLQQASRPFEVYRLLFVPKPSEKTVMSAKEQEPNFLEEFDAEEVEETVCDRDYFVRRL